MEQLLIILILIVILIASLYLGAKTTVEFDSELNSEDLLNKCAHSMSAEGYNAQTRTNNSITLVKDKKPNCIIGGALLCMFVIPAIIYAIIGNSKIPLIVTTRTINNKTRVTVSGIRILIMKLKRKIAY